MESRFVGILAIFLLSILGWIYYLIPGFMKRLWARALGRVLCSLGYRSAVIDQNLRYAWPDDSEEHSQKRRQLHRLAYDHLAFLILEIPMLFGPMKRFGRTHCEFLGTEHWAKAKSLGKGVIILANHVGNWEVMGSAGGHNNVDIMFVTKHLKPEWLHRAVEAARKHCGVKATYEPRTFRDVLTYLHQNGTVGIVLDQYAGPPVGVRVPVFGVPVGTHSVVATLAKRTGAAVVPGLNYRLPDGRYVVEMRAPVPWISDENPTREIALNTANYAKLLEENVRQHPEQWLWIHRRFKGNLAPLTLEEWSEKRPRR